MSITHARAVSPLRVFIPRVSSSTAWVVTSTLGGGLVGGDDIRLSIDVAAGARALVTTQASTKVYRSPRLTRQSLEARVDDEGLLAVLPDPVTPFAASTFEQRQVYALAERANLVVLDSVTAGRRASGERWAFERYASRLEVVRSGRRVFDDHLWLSQADGAVGDRMRRFNVYAMAVLTGPRVEELASRMLAAISSEPVRRGSETVLSVAGLPSTGAVLRLAAVSVEHAAATLRQLFLPLVSVIGEDPWARRW